MRNSFLNHKTYPLECCIRLELYSLGHIDAKSIIRHGDLSWGSRVHLGVASNLAIDGKSNVHYTLSLYTVCTMM